MTQRAWRQEAQVLQDLSHSIANPPCPRVYDQVEDGAGLVMEWCPQDLERWWLGVMDAPEGFRALCQALSEICRRTTEYMAFARERDEPLPIMLCPRTVLRRGDGRWLLTRFGEPERVSVDDSITQIIVNPENFISPEVLFDAASVSPPASQCWALGCMLFSLLQLRVYRREGMPLPDSGTSGHHCRSHRTNLVVDLYQRKAALFTGRALDPREFLYPDRLPDPDRKRIEKSVECIFGSAQPELEAQLSRRLLQILDKALSIDPAARHADPMALGNELELLGRWYRETHQDIVSAHAEKNTSVETRVFEGPLRSKTEQSLDEMQTAITDFGVILQDIRLQQDAMSARLQAAELEAALGRRALWGMVVLLGLLLSVLYSQQHATAGALAAAASAVHVASDEHGASRNNAAPDEHPAQGGEDASEEPLISAPPQSLVEIPAAAASASPFPALIEAPRDVPSGEPSGEPSNEPLGEPSGEPEVDGEGSVSDGKGSISVLGASAWLVGPEGRASPGTLDAGSYEIFVGLSGEAPLSLGVIELAAGDAVQFNCGFGTCKRIQ